MLRDQSIIAGIGNAYSDEILHVAKMSPFKPAAMPEEEQARLYAAIGETLREAVERSDGLAASELKAEKKSGLRVHAKTGQACPVCGDTIREVSFADSSLQYCPTCQTGGKPLADRRHVQAAQVMDGLERRRRRGRLDKPRGISFAPPAYDE